MVNIVTDYDYKPKTLSPVFVDNQEAKKFLDNLSLVAKSLKGNEKGLNDFVANKKKMLKSFHKAMNVLSVNQELINEAMHKRLIFVNRIDDIWETARLRKIRDAEAKEAWNKYQAEKKAIWESEYTIEKECPECHEIIRFPVSDIEDPIQAKIFFSVYEPIWNDFLTGKIKFCWKCEAKANKDGIWRKEKLQKAYEKMIGEAQVFKDLRRLATGITKNNSIGIGYEFEEFCNEFLWYSRDKIKATIPKAKKTIGEMFPEARFHDESQTSFVTEIRI